MSRATAVASVLLMLVSGCGPASPLWMTDRAHKNFLNVIQIQVGRSTADPYWEWNRYPERRGETRRLANGNGEYQYRGYGKCVVFWEADAKTDKVVGVRFEGTPDTCYLVP